MLKYKLLLVAGILCICIFVTGVIMTSPDDFGLTGVPSIFQRNLPTPTRTQNDYFPDFPDYERILKPDLSTLWESDLEKTGVDENGTYRKTLTLPQSLSFDFNWFYATVYDDVSGRSVPEQLVSHAIRTRNLDEEAKVIQRLKYGSQKAMLPDLDADKYVEREVTLKKLGDKDIAYYDFFQDERWSRTYMIYNSKKDRLIYIRSNIYPLFMTNKTSLGINRLEPPDGDIYLEIIGHDEVKRFFSGVESAILGKTF